MIEMIERLGMVRHRRDPALGSINLFGLIAIVMTTAHARAAPNAVRPFPSPMRTDLEPLGGADRDGQERILVLGRRLFRPVPLPGYGNDRAPWETGMAIRDTMTGANTASFGDAYNLGSPLGSDERSNETGGQFVAPRHD